MNNVLENVPLADKTSYRIGGPARYYAEPGDFEEVRGLLKLASEWDMPTLVLGNGSNMLVGDGGFDGLVINMSVNLTKITWDDNRADVWCGFPLDKLAAESAARGLSGMEELSGIPGTVGGAIVMNAGAFGTETAHTLQSARVLKVPSMEIETVSAADLALGYRSSALKGGRDVVLSAVFEFKPEDTRGQALATREDILRRRREKQPLDKPSCGSVFKRPEGNYAGTLIESCGLKGFKIGAAMVSDKHANFIVNTGGATASDVRRVIDHIQKVVQEKHGIELSTEVIFVGKA